MLNTEFFFLCRLLSRFFALSQICKIDNFLQFTQAIFLIGNTVYFVYDFSNTCDWFVAQPKQHWRCWSTFHFRKTKSKLKVYKMWSIVYFFFITITYKFVILVPNNSVLNFLLNHFLYNLISCAGKHRVSTS